MKGKTVKFVYLLKKEIYENDSTFLYISSIHQVTCQGGKFMASWEPQEDETTSQRHKAINNYTELKIACTNYKLLSLYKL